MTWKATFREYYLDIEDQTSDPLRKLLTHDASARQRTVTYSGRYVPNGIERFVGGSYVAELSGDISSHFLHCSRHVLLRQCYGETWGSVVQ